MLANLTNPDWATIQSRVLYLSTSCPTLLNRPIEKDFQSLQLTRTELATTSIPVLHSNL